MGTTLSGRLLLYNAKNMSFRELGLRCDPDAKPITELIDYVQFCGAPMNDHEADQTTPVSSAFHRVSVTDAKSKLDSGWKPFVLDVRKPNEADIVKLSFTNQLEPHESAASIVGDLPTHGDILVHCKRGRRSAIAIESLIVAGVDAKRLYNLEGGITAWAQQIDKRLPTY
jgi:adenylyltransferase/sulfurtransferase